MRGLARRLWMLFARRRFDRDLEEEMRLHLDLAAEEARAQGLSEDDARAEARRRFGNEAALREESRDAWGLRWLDDLVQDARYGVRALARSPGFTAVVVLALALGIGANTAILSVVDAVLFRPLPYGDPDRLAVVLHDGVNPVSPANFLDWRAQATSFDGLGAAEVWSPNLSGVDRPEQVRALRMTPDLLRLLGVAPALGRLFGDDEGRPGRDRVVVLGWEGWQRRFAGDPAVLGRVISLDGERYTVVGVMPAAFRFAPFWATRSELFAPLDLSPRATNRGGNSLRVFGRLARGVSLGTARAEVASIAARLEATYPGSNRNVQVVPLREKVVGDVRPALLVLLGAVGFVLLAACANVAHMLLARAQARRREVVLRAALGASRGRIVRQFLTESLLLAALGGGAGLLLGTWGIELLLALRPADLPSVVKIGVDGRVLAVMAGVSLLAGVAFGVLPALRSTSGDLAGALKEGGHSATEGASRGRLRDLLVVTQFALALPLLVGAGLMIRSFASLMAIDPGFSAAGVASAQISVAGAASVEPGRRAVLYPELIRRAAALPGVTAASAINHLPLAGDEWGFGYAIDGAPLPKPEERDTATLRAVLSGYFAALGVPLLRGRDFTGADRLGADPVAIVNQRLADAQWPGQDAIGRRVLVADFQGEDKWHTIVGVAKDVRQSGWASAPRPEIYLPLLQVKPYLDDPAGHFAYLTVVLRGPGDPAALIQPLRQLVRELDPSATVSEATTLAAVVDKATAQPRFHLVLLGVFAALALILAAVGIYGVMSYAVSRRTQELGIRLALGATGGDVFRLVVGQGLLLAAIGSALGLAASLALARVMSSLLHGVGATDPLTLACVTALLGLVAALASFLPARRATRIDPMLALRND